MLQTECVIYRLMTSVSQFQQMLKVSPLSCIQVGSMALLITDCVMKSWSLALQKFHFYNILHTRNVQTCYKIKKSEQQVAAVFMCLPCETYGCPTPRYNPHKSTSLTSCNSAQATITFLTSGKVYIYLCCEWNRHNLQLFSSERPVLLVTGFQEIY
jgi:hypothetical protein